MKISKYETRIGSARNVFLAECGTFKVDGRRVYNNPAELADFFSDTVGLRTAAEEFVYVACLDTKLHLIGCFEASHGSCNASMFPVREIFQKALLIGAVHIVICHNHPSGDPTPSKDDITSTDRLVSAGSLIGVTVLDHVIIGAGTDLYVSMQEYKYMN